MQSLPAILLLAGFTMNRTREMMFPMFPTEWTWQKFTR
uniref:Uncharacterized protein n=1 Tax=Picea sitchensis TaxID=3332 RepID=A0A6B9XV19_PICSI|nr:hypothetical protein Q903MT_gene4004 [Picea sitchensis]